MKKMVKKIFAIVAAAAMVSQMCCVMGYAEETDSDLIFDLSVSYDSINYTGVAEDETGNFSISYQGNNFHIFTQSNGVKALHIGNAQDQKGYIFMATEENAQKPITDGTMSVEMWISTPFRKTGYQSVIPFSMLGEVTEANSVYRTMIMDSDNNTTTAPCVYSRPGLIGNPSKDVTTSNLIAENKWFHIVSVRDMINKKSLLYINGSLVTGCSRDLTQAENYDFTKPINFEFGNGYNNLDVAEAKIYSRALTDAEISTKYEDSYANYLTTFTAVKAPGTTVNRYNNLAVDFDNVIDEHTANTGNVVLTRTDDEEISNYAVSVNPDNNKQLIISVPGGFPEAEYSLNLTSGLKSKNGIAFAGQTYTFTANSYLVYEDYQGSDSVVNSSPATGKGIAYSSDVGAPSIKENGTDKYVEFTKSAGINDYKAMTLYSEFESSLIQNYDVVAEWSVAESIYQGDTLNNNLSTPSTYYGFINGIHTSAEGCINVFNAGEGNQFRRAAWKAGTVTFGDNYRDANGYMRIKNVYYLNASGNVVVKTYFYNVLNNDWDDPYLTTTTQTALNKINYVFSFRDNANVSHSIRVSDASIKIIPKTVVVEKFEKGADKKSLYLTLSEDIDAFKYAIDAPQVSVMQGNTTVGILNTEYVEATRTIILTSLDELSNQDCRIILNGLYVDGGETAVNLDYNASMLDNGLNVIGCNYIGNGTAVETLNNTLTSITANVLMTNNHSIDTSCVVFFAIYDSNDTLKYIQMEESGAIEANAQNVSIPVTINNMTIDGNMYGKVFIWKSPQSCTPICKSFGIPYCL